MRNRRRARRSRSARLLILLGVAAQLAAALALVNVDALVEYAAPAPDVREIEASEGQAARVDTGLEGKIEALDGVREALEDDVTALSMSGMKAGMPISRDAESAVATLVAVEPGWLETCPRPLTAGRWMDAAELARGAKLAALDEDLAFALFGSEEAVDREIEIDGVRYQVVGVARHRRGPGEADAYAAYVPLRAASKQGLQLDTLTMHALSAISAGLGQSLQAAASEAWGPGELHDLQKERMGALLLSRLIVCAFALALLFRLARAFARQVRRWWAQIAARQSHAYLRGWLGMALVRALGALLGAALLLAAAYATLRIAIEPVYRFTEWVPESLVSLKAIQTVFWSRTSDAARLISIQTPASARIAFWGALDRFGAVALLLGLALGKKNLHNCGKSWNQTSGDGV